VSAEVYKWVDEHGKTHYGDTIPEKYKDKGKSVDLNKSNIITSKQRPKSNERFKFKPLEEEKRKTQYEIDQEKFKKQQKYLRDYARKQEKKAKKRDAELKNKKPCYSGPNASDGLKARCKAIRRSY
jgi:hypothetical protein